MKIKKFLARSVVLSLVLFVCTASSALATGSATVTLSSFKIKLSKSSFKAGKVKFTVNNNSGTTHNFCVKGSGVSKCTPTFSKGTKTLTVSLKKGSYNVTCSVDGHKDLGMKGKIKAA